MGATECLVPWGQVKNFLLVTHGFMCSGLYAHFCSKCGGPWNIPSSKEGEGFPPLLVLPLVTSSSKSPF